MQKKSLVFKSLAFIGVAALLISALAFQHPMTAYAITNPGLDSGNAQVTTVGSDTVLSYKTGNSTFKAPAGVSNIRVMVIGGGGGGASGGGGGGAGRMVAASSVPVTPGVSHAITVGSGGTAGTSNSNGGTGGSSSIGSLAVAPGGGGGGGYGKEGLNGGSGGGIGRDKTGGSVALGNQTGTVPAGGTGLGNNGGTSNCTNTWCGGGGGGGAGAVGGNGYGNGNQGSEIAGRGGNGSANDITGTSTTYAGGGGGGIDDTADGGAGGSGGGGGGANRTGAANTGSGGGGAGYNHAGGAGGSGIVVIRFATQNINAPSPGGVTGLTMWYKADSAGNTNALWNDSSGFGYNLTQGTGSKQPALTTNSLNFNPAYVFDGTDDAFSLAGHGIGGNQPLSGFFAALSNSNVGGYRYFNEFGDDSPSFSIYNGKPDMDARVTSPVSLRYSAEAAFSPHVFSYISPNANSQSRIIGVDDQEESQNVTTGTYVTSSGGFAGNSFGRTNGSNGTSWSGPIGEAMYFNKVLTPAERLKIISYLSIKYGVTRYQGASGAGYSDSAGTTIWPADATFKNNIAGIGRDDASALMQKQSKSTVTAPTTDIVTVGHVAIAANNQANTNSFGVDKAFFLWGHNNAATDQSTTVDGGYVRMPRIWKGVRTTSMGTLKVRVPKTAVTQGNNGVMYLSTSTTFDASSTKINMTDLGTEYEATITTLPAATTYFSFGSLIGADLEVVSKKAYVPGTNTEVSNYVPGQPIEYKVAIKNNGPGPASNLTFTDLLPTGIVPTAGGSTSSGWSCTVAGQTVTCTRASLPSGSTEYVITTEATIASSVTGSRQNTASVSSASTDPNPSNNSKTLTLTPTPKADLGITKVHQGQPTAGGQYHYNFTVTNNGPSDATGFQVTDTLSDTKLTFDHVAGNPNVSCTGQGTSSFTCTFSGATLANNGNATFQAYINVAGDYVGGPVTNTGTVAVVGATDPNSSNNTSTPDTTNVILETQLSVAKEPNAGPTAHFIAGENNVYKINVTSQGASQSPTNSITVTDTLSEEYSFVSAIGTNWTCGHTDGTVTCTYGTTLDAGNTTSDILLTVAVDPIATGTVPNTAEVSSTTPDPDLSDNASTHNTIVDSEVDLALVKGHVGTAFVAGQQEQYTFSVTNAGPSADSPSYTITDTLPTGVTFVSTEPGSAATCVGASGNTIVNCTGGAIEAGDPAQVTTINVAVGGGVTGTIDNSATVTAAAGSTDTNPTNNTGEDNGLPIEPNADLSVTKTPSTDMTAGDTDSYTITVHNDGPSNVASFTIVDILDANLTFQTSPGCSVTDTLPDGRQEVTCTGGAINSGDDSTPITINVLVQATATSGSTITNTVSVAPPTGVNDPSPGNNNDSVDRNVLASADLQITKSHTGNFTAGANNDFTIVVTNAGPSDAGPFTMTDTLPAGMTYVNAVNTAGVGVSCTNAGQIVTCTGNPGIGAGQTSTITLTVAVDGNIAGNTVINNSATVSSGTPDPNLTNNTTPADAVTVDSEADLEIEKINDTDFTAGADEDYTIAVINHGPSNVSGFTVTDVLPAELTFVPVGSDPICSEGPAQTVTCDGGALVSGDSTSFKIRVHTDSGLTAGTVVNNTADVATIAPTTDPDNGNNSSTDPTSIVNVTDLSIQKSAVGDYTAGSTGQFAFTVSNGGPSATPAGDVRVTDSLPGGMTYDSFTGTNWDCSASSGQTVDCTYTPSLAVSGSTPTLTVTVNIPADMSGQVQNTGIVQSTFDDSDPADDTSTITVNVGAEADLTATKTAQSAGPFVAGQNITYRFEVTNDGGPSLANDVVITDNLQDDFTYQSFASVSGGTWDCSEASGTVTCTLPSLDVSDTAVVDVTLTIAEDAPNPLANTAAVTFNGTDPSPANPSASDPLTYSADLEVDITHEQKTYRAGDTVDYIVTAINHGPSAAEDAVLTVTIPEGLTIEHVSAQAPGGDSILSALDSFFFSRALAASNPFGCTLNGNKLICTASTMFVGSYPLYVTGKINNSFSGQLVLSANITSSTPDPNLSDETASDTISDVLAATGQNIWIWIGVALAMIAASIIIVIRIRKAQYSKL